MKAMKALGWLLAGFAALALVLSAFGAAATNDRGPLKELFARARALEEAAAVDAQQTKAAASARRNGESALAAADAAAEQSAETLIAIETLAAALDAGDSSGDAGLDALRAAAKAIETGAADSKAAAEALAALIADEGRLQALTDALDAISAASGDLSAQVNRQALALFASALEDAHGAADKAAAQIEKAFDGANGVFATYGAAVPKSDFARMEAPAPDSVAACVESAAELDAYAQSLPSRAGEALDAVSAAEEWIAERVSADRMTTRERAALLIARNYVGFAFTGFLLALAALILIFRLRQFLSHWNKNPVFSTFIALIAIMAVQVYALGFANQSFGAWADGWYKNAFNVLRANASVGMIALGMTLVVITGGIDLAVGSTLAGVGTVMMLLLDTSGRGVLMNADITGVPAFILAIAAGMLTGLAIGGLIGLMVTKGRVAPFIITLGVMNIVRSVAQYFTKSYTLKVPAEFSNIANVVVFGQRILPVVYWLILAVIIYLVMRHTAFGRYVYAVGSNERTTRLSGINVDRVKLKVYMLMGFIVSIAAVAQLARLGNMDVASAGSGYELDAIAAVVVGGTAMSGGKGSVIGTMLGVLIIGIMNNLLILLGVDSFLTEAFKGAIVIFAVLMQRKEKLA